MSKNPKNVIQRQWQIVLLLIEGHYVSTSDIQQYLKEQQIESEIRTIQRDLVLLEDIFPLECRKDDKPYSWRWQQMPNSKKQDMTVTQALAFRLIETELKDLIPSDLLESLEPLLMKARFNLALVQFGNNAVSLGDADNKDMTLTPEMLASLSDSEARKILSAEKEKIKVTRHKTNVSHEFHPSTTMKYHLKLAQLKHKLTTLIASSTKNNQPLESTTKLSASQIQDMTYLIKILEDLHFVELKQEMQIFLTNAL